MNENQIKQTWRRLIVSFLLGATILLVAILFHSLGSKRPTPQALSLFVGVLGLVLILVSATKMRAFHKWKQKELPSKDEPKVDKSMWRGKDFEFLISGDLEISSQAWDEMMTPNSMPWKKVMKSDWAYFQVGEDEFSYSSEMAGIQMTFNPEITYTKAKQIADEVIENIKRSGQEAELIEITGNLPISFD